MLYEELLEISKPRFDRFLEHVARFEGMFTWGDLQQRCYEAMYVCNDPADPAAVKALKEEIPELRDLCSSCAAFYIPARNKSIPKYDVLLGKQYEDVLMEFLEKKLGAPVVRADLEDRRMPDCKLLRPDGSAAAYFEVKFHGAPFVLAKNKTGRHCYEGSATLDLEKVRRQLQLVDEGLDAPVFYVHWLEYPLPQGRLLRDGGAGAGLSPGPRRRIQPAAAGRGRSKIPAGGLSPEGLPAAAADGQL